MKLQLLPLMVRALLALSFLTAVANQNCLAAGDDKAFNQLLEQGMDSIRMNQWQRAEQLLNKSLKEAEKFGPSDKRVGASLVNLGVVYGQKKQWDRAVAVMKRALDIDIKVHGNTHADVAYDLHQLGSYLDFSARNSEATPYLRRALAMRQSLPGLSPSLIGITAENLGANLARMGKTQEAETNFRLALKCFKDGKDPVLYFRRLESMGEFYFFQDKQTSNAANFYKTELADIDHRFGPEGPWAASFLHHQGSFYLEAKDYHQAEAAFRRLVAMAPKMPPEALEQRAAAQNGLAVALYKQGKCEQAAPCFEQAISLLERAGLPRQAAVVKSNYADCLEKLGKKKASDDMRRRAEN